MSTTIVVTGTDTNVGETVFCAGLLRLLNGVYWKPIQSGLDVETDSEIGQRLSGVADDRILPEAWRLHRPASPHRSAEIDEVAINPAMLNLPVSLYPVIIEGVGGLMVPLTRRPLLINVFARWGAPAVLCARIGLGTINHTLLSIEALRRRAISLLGVAFIGEAHADNEPTIATLGGVRVLSCLPHLDSLTPYSLAAAFSKAFSPDSFTHGTPR